MTITFLKNHIHIFDTKFLKVFFLIFWNFGLFIYVCKMLRIFNTNFLASFIFLNCELYVYIYLPNANSFMLQPQKIRHKQPNIINNYSLYLKVEERGYYYLLRSTIYSSCQSLLSKTHAISFHSSYHISHLCIFFCCVRDCSYALFKGILSDFFCMSLFFFYFIRSRFFLIVLITKVGFLCLYCTYFIQ